MNKRKRILAQRIIASLIVAVIFVVLFIVFIWAENCPDFGCFERNMVICSRAAFVNEEPDASWLYNIKGRSKGMCEIKVTLLIAKEGELGIDEFEGNSMNCFYDIGVSAFPEKNLDLCHGRLKEDLQGVIIEKLHSYVLDNLGEIKDELEGI